MRKTTKIYKDIRTTTIYINEKKWHPHFTKTHAILLKKHELLLFVP